MKIYDCFSYWDEDLLLDVRLNILARDMSHYQEIYRSQILLLPHIADIEALMLISNVMSKDGVPL